MFESKPNLTLVIGATGKTGRRLVDRLEAAGRRVRIGSRSAEPAFDWSEPAGWAAALDGVDAVYIAYYPDLAVAEAPGQITALMEACKTAGVQKIVLLSGRGEANAQRCEQIVRDCGLDYTLVRAAWFNQNFDEGHLIEAVRAGVLALPGGDVREPFVDADDIADVAFAALTDDRHNGELYELTGPELLHFSAVTDTLSRAAGHNVQYTPISFEQHEQQIAEQAGEAFAAFLTALMRETLDGRNQSLGDGVQRALGRAPRRFADYAAQVAATGVWEVEHANS